MTPLRPPGRLFALIPALILLLAVVNLDVPYFSISPGPAEEVSPLIAITGAQTFPAKGKLLLTTVSLRPVHLGEAVAGWLDPVVDVIPRSAIIPKGTTEKQVDKVNLDQMEESKRAAGAAALALLGYALKVSGAGARIEDVLPGSPAENVLKPGDVVVGVDRRGISDADDLIAQVRRKKVGQSVMLRVLRDGTERDLKVATMRSSREPNAPMIGVNIRTEAGKIEFPFGVDIRSMGIGGPSAGLMFALGIVDVLQEGELTKGLAIAGTGVISSEGKVAPVGGVAQKVAAAERAGAAVFLVPREELRDARRAAHRIRVIGVRNLSEAVQALNDLKLPVEASSR